jgi:hypothetical protein
MPSSEKKGRRLTPPPAFRPLPRVFYRYPATIPAKLPDAISRLLRTRLAFAQYSYRAATAVLMKVTRLFATALTPSPIPV